MVFSSGCDQCWVDVDVDYVVAAVVQFGCYVVWVAVGVEDA